MGNAGHWTTRNVQLTEQATIRIVISYRRQDTPGGAGRLRESLAEHFGRENVFLDIDTIPPGVPWRKAIDKTISECDVLLPVIGMHWLSVTDEQGRRRLDQPDDVLRFEIASALSSGVKIIPVQLHGARMPGPDDLPDQIAELAEYQSIRIDDDDWPEDMKKLVRALNRIRDEKAGAVGVARDTIEVGQPGVVPPPAEQPPVGVEEQAGGIARWLGATGPEASEAQRRKRKRWQLAGYIAGALFLLLSCTPTAEDQEEYGAAGAFFGNLIVGLGVALLLRLAYVKLLRRDGRPFLSPWILAIAIPIALASANS